MTRSTTRRPRRRRIIAAASAVAGLAVLGVGGELALRGVIDHRIDAATALLPPGMTVTRDTTPALLQLATGQAAVWVEISPEALTDRARTLTRLRELQVEPAAGNLVAQVPISIAGGEQTVDVLLTVTAEGGRAVLRADSIRFAGLTLPVTAVAEQLESAHLDAQLGTAQLERLADGVVFPEGESEVAISSARATKDGLELGAEVAMWG